jgi:Uma2 family endonuclease
MALAEGRLHRFTVEDYLRLAAGTDTGRWDRTELVEGIVYDMSPESSLHAKAVRALFQALTKALPDHDVYNTGSIEIDEGSLWEPDIYALRPGVKDRQYPLGSDVGLVVEVGLTTLAGDLNAKYRGYADCGIPDYWVLAPEIGGYLLRHRKPAGDRYETVERIELPGGYADLDVAGLL